MSGEREMYNQRRYGGPADRKPSTPRGNPDSRRPYQQMNRMVNRGGLGGPKRTPVQSSAQDQPKVGVKAKVNEKQDVALIKDEPAIDSGPQSTETAHHPSEDSYLVREVDLTSEHVNQPSAGQRTEQGNNVKREVDDRKRRHDDERPRDTNKAKRQYEVSNANRQAVWQKSETALKNVTEGDATDAAFGMVRVNGKRMIDIDSLVSPQETKHSGRSRLFIANLAPGVNEADFKTLFERFGNPTEIFVNKEKSFGFVKLDCKVTAEIARNSLDGYVFKGRPMRVKFAAHQSAIEIHGIDKFTSNESLEAAFSIFGAVERATVVCDERGRSKCYAIIDFTYKKAAQNALQRINEGLFVLGRLPKPVTAKPLTQIDEEGIHEKDLERVLGLSKDREYKARFIVQESPEYGMAKKWRELEEEGRLQREKLENQLENDRHKMEFDFESAIQDQEADFIHQELLQKQAALEEEIRKYDEMRNIRDSVMMRKQGQNFDKRHPNMRVPDEREMHFRGMPAASMGGLGGLNPAAALAMAASGNLLQVMKGQDPLSSHQVTQRMPVPRVGPMGMPHRGPAMMGMGNLPPRPLLDMRQGLPHGGLSMPGMRRPGIRDSLHNKRPRK